MGKLNIRVYPYRRGSRSALALARAMGGRRLPFEEVQPLPEDCIVINWGASGCPYPKALNQAEKVKVAGNKLQAFSVLKEAVVSIPEFARRREDVSWDGLTVVRHKLTGHSGEGIEIIEGKELPNAPLYVKYIKKEQEYRVHIIGEEIVLVQRKARRRHTRSEDINWKVRSHANGFVFARNDEELQRLPTSITDTARQAINALGLDFGAVDLIWNAKAQKVYVLEVNTAPGMEGSTINDYARGFRRMLNA